MASSRINAACTIPNHLIEHALEFGHGVLVQSVILHLNGFIAHQRSLHITRVGQNYTYTVYVRWYY